MSVFLLIGVEVYAVADAVWNSNIVEKLAVLFTQKFYEVHNATGLWG